MLNKLYEIYQYRDMINSLVKRELRGKYAKSVLGFLWSFLNPMFQIIIYTIVFKFIFTNDMDNYYIFLMSGLLPWTFFAESFSTGSMIINSNAEMVKKIYFPREVLVIAEVNAKMVNLLLSFIVMAVFIVISGIGFSWHLCLLPLVVITEYMFALGFSFIVAAITVYLRDMEYITNVVLMAWVWGTPIMYYHGKVITPALRKILFLNPMTPIIISYQDILYWHRMPSIQYLIVSLLEGIVILFVGSLIFNRLSKGFVEEM